MLPEMDKTRFLASIEMEYAFFMRTLSSFSPDQLPLPIRDNWSVKDTIVHISAWLTRATDWIEEAQLGSRPNITDEMFSVEGVNVFNEQIYQQNRDRSLDEILIEFNQCHWRMVRIVNSLSEEDLFVNTFNEAFRYPVWKLIAGNSSEHYYEHAVWLREWLAAHAQPPTR